MTVAYVELMRLRLLSLLAHRVNVFSGVLTYTVYIAGYYFFWMAAFGDRGEMGGMTPGQMATYLAVGYMARAFYFNNLDHEVAAEVRDGTVAVQLTRPVPYLGQKLAGALGQALFRLCFFSIPGFALAAVLFPVRLPRDWSLLLPYTAGIALAFCLNAQLNLLTGLLSVWSARIQGVIWARRLLVDLLSGLYLPLSLFPAWLREALAWTPFPGISYVPSLIFAGTLRGGAAWAALARSALWVLLLALALRLLWRLATRRLTVHGG